MYICITIGGVRHCYGLPIFKWPLIPPHGPGGPENYPALLLDAVLLASLRETATHVHDERVRKALETGIGEALQSMRDRAGDHVTISETPIGHQAAD